MNASQVPMLPNPSIAPRSGSAPQGDSEQNPLALLHGLLRGRYPLAIAMGLVLAVIGGGVGYVLTTPEFESSAIIRVAPVLPKVLYESEQNASLPMFDAYVGTQVSLIKSRRVIDMALQSPTWAEVGGAYSLESVEEFSEKLLAGQPSKSQLIKVSYTDPDPRRARAGVKSAVDAYLSIYVEGDQFADAKRLDLLEARERTLSADLDRNGKQILDIANEFGSSALSEMHEYEVQQLQALKTQLEATRLEVVSMEARANDGGNQLNELSVEQIAAMDGRMQALTDNLRAVEFQVSEIEATYRNPEKRPEYKSAVREVESQKVAIEEYAAQFRNSYSPETGTVLVVGAASVDPKTRLENAQARVVRLQTLYDEAKASTIDLGRKNLQIESLRSEAKKIQERLDSTRFRIEQLNVESAVPGRITLLSEPEIPLRPSNARRRLQLAILGGLGGGGLGVASIILLGLVNPRVRDTADAEKVRPRLLGALPGLSDCVTSPDEAVLASQCVHHIRTMLATQRQRKQASVFTVTSSSSGTGKTSLTLSLGLAFAMAGARTLLIDGDLVGLGLTRRTGVVGRPRLGRVFRDYEIVSESEAKHALGVAARRGMRIGDALCELGYINDVDLKEGLAIQEDLALGLSDALNGERVEACIGEFGIPNLSILPGSHQANGAPQAMSTLAMRGLIDSLRGAYDVILIDSGPLPGTTDATVMSASADGVIMVVSRGDLHSNVKRAIDHVHRIDATLAGVVMNRATTRDLRRSGHCSSYGNSSAPDAQAARAETSDLLSARLQEYAQYGPLAQSVLSVAVGS